MSFAALAERRRLALVWVGTLGFVALVVVSLLQTASGLASSEVGVAAAALYLLGIGLLAAAFLAALLALHDPAHGRPATLQSPPLGQAAVT